MPISLRVLLLIACLAPALTVYGQGFPEPSVELQKEKLAVLANMDGIWRGSGWIMSPTGERSELTQTERVGPMLGGALRVIEGRGYSKDGELAFNAFAIVSYDTQKEQYTMRSYARGRQGDFEFQPRDDGFSWTVPAGPATIRYTAKIKDGHWHEVGERIAGEGVATFFEMSLERIGDTGWPAEGAVPPQ